MVDFSAPVTGVAPYWARYANAAITVPTHGPDEGTNALGMFGKRIFEEFGIRDVWDELARLGDDGINASGILKNLFGVDDPSRKRPWALVGLIGQTLNAPLQAAVAGAQEANRAAGAAWLASPLRPFATSPTDFSARPLENYLTGGMSWQEQEDVYARSAPGIYRPLTFGEVDVIAHDQMIKDGKPRLLANLMHPFSWVGSEDRGPLTAGSYVPRAFDLLAANAGEQLDQSGIYQSQRIVSNLASEVLLDPLNWAAGPMSGVLNARRGFTLVPSEGAALSHFLTPGADLTGAMEISKVERGLRHRPGGMGLWNQARMLEALQGQAFRPVLDFVRDTRDPARLEEFFWSGGRRQRMANTRDEAHHLALVASRLDTDAEVVHFFNAATYRNVDSIQVLDNKLADTVTLNDTFRSGLGLQHDMFDQALLDFPEGGVLPKGHVMADNARQMLTEVLDDDPVAKAAWDALGTGAQHPLIRAVDEQRLPMHAMERLFGPQAAVDPATGERIVENAAEHGMGVISFIPRARYAAKWMSGPRTYALEGTRFSRYNPRILLMDKPGLVFGLHGEDAVAKFNDMIRWADTRITGQGSIVRSWNYRPVFADGYRFTVEHDPQVRALHQRFVDAGVVSGSPEEVRADLVTDLQTLMLQRMAEATGFEPKIAEQLALRGMDKGRNLVNGLRDAERGYITPVLEDGRALYLAAQPTVERQAANFVPLMDWDAAWKAMWAVRRTENALGRDPSEIISAAEAEMKYFGKEAPSAGRPLKYVGRESTLVGSTLGRGTHALVDLADAVNHVFKVSVLLRLGYPFRNLAEGAASAVASGLSVSQLLAYLDLGGLMWQRLNNLWHLPNRLIDRTLVHTGLRASDDARLQFAQAAAEVNNLHEDRLHEWVSILGSERTFEQLAARATDQALTAAERQDARDALDFVVAQKQRLALGISQDNVANALPFRPVSSMQAAQHLYHADTSGGLGARRTWDAEGVYGIDQRLDRPIRLVDDPVLAHGHVDSQWVPVAARGAVLADREATFAATVRTAGGGSLFRYTDATGRARQTTRAATVLQRADPAQPVTVHRTRAATPTRPAAVYAGRPVALPPPTVRGALRAQGIRKGSHHLQMRQGPNDLWVPYDRRLLTSTTEVRALEKATHPDFPKVVSVDTWGAELDLRTQQGVAHALARYRDVDQPLLDAAMHGDQAAQDRLSNVLAGHGVYRVVLPDSRVAGWARYQVLVHPNGVGQQGFEDAVRREVTDYVEAAARNRDVKTSERDLRVKRLGGSVRTMGGLSRREIRRMNRTPMPEFRTAAERAEWAQRTMGRVGQPVVPTHALDTVRILQDGGFEHAVTDLVDAAIRSRRDRYVAQHLYRERMAELDSLVKMRGIRDAANAFRMTGAYGQEYPRRSLLGGADGAVFGKLASGDASYLMGMSQTSYLTEIQNDIMRSQLRPRLLSPDDPRYFDGLANLWGRQYRDQQGLAAGGVDNLDPAVRRLLAPGDRVTVISDTVDWALHSDEGRQWVRTLGLNVVPPRGTAAEVTEAARRWQRRQPRTPATTRAQRRTAVETAWRDPSIGINDATVGEVVATMANFLDNHVLPSERATALLLDGGDLSGDALRAAHQAEPWDLKPISGLLSPTSAESRTLLRNHRAAMGTMESVNHWLVTQLAKGMKAIGSGPETRLLRHPVFEAVGQMDLRQRVMFAEASLGRALNLDEFAALKGKSMRFALNRMERTLYTLTGRSAVDDWMRLIAPFFPAWKNALTRWGRLTAEQPGRVGRLASRVAAVGRPMTMVNENGEPIDFSEANLQDSYILLPGIGGLAERLTGIPGVREAMRNTRISLRTMDLLFQGDMLSPGSGPFVAMPAQMLLTGHPEWLNNTVVKWLSTKVFPYGPTDTGNVTLDYAEQFMPTALRKSVERWLKPEAYMTERIRNQWLIQSGIASGEIEPMTTNEILDQAERLTKFKMTVKVLSSLASPVAQQQTGDVEFYAANWRQLRDAYGSAERADQEFEQLYPAQFLMTLSATKNLTGGAATSRAVGNQKRYRGLQQLAQVEGATGALGFFENYDDEAFSQGSASEGFTQEDYNPFARRWQRSHAPEGSPTPFRRSLTPEEAQRRTVVEQGYRDLDQTKAAIARNLVQQGLAPGSFEFMKQLDGALVTAKDLIAAENPVWADEDGLRDEGRLVRNERFFRAALDHPEYGFITKERNGQALIQSIRAYFGIRDTIRGEIYKRVMADRNWGTTSSAVDNNDLANRLVLVRAALSQDSPAFAEWVDKYFRNDLVSIDNADVLGAA